MKRLLVISPCRNEIEYLERSVGTVLCQTVLPDLWVIVDDGSSDGTAEFLRSLAAKHSFIRIVHRQDRGFRKVGAGVVDAFYEGLENACLGDYEFVCKLDLDLKLPPRYFELLVALMNRNPKLGTCSGKPFVISHDGQRRYEPAGDEMSVGMTKFYRIQCFVEIGGFVSEVMWDGIDCHRCRMKGWMARSLRHPELDFEHMRPMGSSQQSIYTGRRRHGYGQYFMGSSLWFIVASCAYRALEKPVLLGSLFTLTEYIRSWIRRKPRYADDDFRCFLRRYQRVSLIFGKARAVQLIDAANGNSFYAIG